ncbi:arsenate reductase [Citrobacter sp. TBCS-14]|nr:arsenate reductase [Citrobacter sp. TBCS-14]
MPAMSLNMISHVGIRSVNLYVYNFNGKVSSSHGFDLPPED